MEIEKDNKSPEEIESIRQIRESLISKILSETRNIDYGELKKSIAFIKEYAKNLKKEIKSSL